MKQPEGFIQEGKTERERSDKRERVEEGELKIDYVAGEDNLADIFTKPLPGPRFHRLRTLLGVMPPK